MLGAELSPSKLSLPTDRHQVSGTLGIRMLVASQHSLAVELEKLKFGRSTGLTDIIFAETGPEQSLL
jgi:hypothetical protein